MNPSAAELWLQAFDKQIAEDPDDCAYAYFNRANALADLGRHEEAIASYERAIEECGDEDEDFTGAVLTNQANALVALDRADEALAVYEQAIAIDPEQPRHHGRP